MALGLDTYRGRSPTIGCSPKCRVVDAARRRRLERSLCSIPWQPDFPRGNLPTVKGAL